jgi:V/A-type H+/Na+-transporting ATPase subunit K
MEDMEIGQLLAKYFVEAGTGWAAIGAIAAAMLGGIGSAQGLRISGAQAAGVMSKKPELFGKLLVLIALPGTQGFYGFITFFIICLKAGLLAAAPAMNLDFVRGLALMFVGICSGVVQWRSAIYQGETSAAAISLVAKRPEESGRAIILPALVETYAVVALLSALLLTFWITATGPAA